MSSTIERTLRVSTLVSSVFAFSLLLPATIESGKVYQSYSRNRDSFIGYGFIPLAFTVVTSAVYLVLKRLGKGKDAEAAHVGSDPKLWITADFLIFGGYFVALVFEWTHGLRRLQNAANIAFLEAYATVPLMVNMLIHMAALFINLKPAFRALLAKKWTKTEECPHCHHRIGAPTPEVVQKGSGEGYSLLRGEDYDDDAGRASEDRAAIGTVEEV